MKKLVALFALGVLMVFACSKKSDVVKLEPGTPAFELAKQLSSTLPALDPVKNEVLVKSNDFDITSGEVIATIYESMGTRSSQLQRMNAERLRMAISRNAEGIAEKKLLIREAEKAGSSVSEAEVDSIFQAQYARAGGEEAFLKMLQGSDVKIEDVKKQMREGLLIQNFLDKVLANETEITEDDIRKVYDEDKTATVRHILLMTQGKSDSEKVEIRKKMEGILAQARAGADFAELAKKYTEDPGSKENGGLYENFGRGRMVKPFEDAAFSVPIGEISDIVETRYGYHIIKVVSRQKETRPFEEVRPQIEAQLKRKKQSEAYIAHMDKLKAEAGMEVVEF